MTIGITSIFKTFLRPFLKKVVLITVNYSVSSCHKPLINIAYGLRLILDSPKPKSEGECFRYLPILNLSPIGEMMYSRRGVLRSNRGGVHPYTEYTPMQLPALLMSRQQ